MKSEAFLKLLGDVRGEYIVEAAKPVPRRARRFPAKLLIAAALLALAVGGAVAARQSKLLGHIFRNSVESPTPAVEAHLVQVDGEGEATEGVSFHVDEYLLDDDKLYLTWTSENHTGKPLIFLGPFIEGEGEFELREGNVLSAAGGEVLGQSLPEAYSETTGFSVSGSGEGPVKVTLVALEPVTEFVDSQTSSPNGKPVIVWDAGLKRPESFCSGYYVGPAKVYRDGKFVDDDGSDGFGPWMSAHYSYDDWEALLGKEWESLDLGRWAETAERLGYVKLAKRWDLELTLEKGAARRTLARELPRFDFMDFTLVVTEFTQTDVSNRLRMQAVPKREGVFDDGGPQFEIYVNGATEEPWSRTGWGYILNDGWEIDGATPVDDTPRIAAEDIEWLNDGEPIREIRLETEDGESVDWKL